MAGAGVDQLTGPGVSTAQKAVVHGARAAAPRTGRAPRARRRLGCSSRSARDALRN